MSEFFEGKNIKFHIPTYVIDTNGKDAVWHIVTHLFTLCSRCERVKFSRTLNSISLRNEWNDKKYPLQPNRWFVGHIHCSDKLVRYHSAHTTRERSHKSTIRTVHKHVASTTRLVKFASERIRLTLIELSTLLWCWFKFLNTTRATFVYSTELISCFKWYVPYLISRWPILCRAKWNI